MRSVFSGDDRRLRTDVLAKARDGEVRRHDLGGDGKDPLERYDATGWGMVISGRAMLEMRNEKSVVPCHMILNEGDVWSVPASASAWLHCLDDEKASVVMFVGGREPALSEPGQDWCHHETCGSQGVFCHHLLDQAAEATHWGNIRVIEADAFCDPDALSAAFIEINSGCCTDLHWHLNTSVWQICLDGRGAVTCVPAGEVQQVRQLGSGVVSHVPRAEGYFIRNDGDKPLRILEIFRSDHYHDLSLPQWLAASTPEAIATHLCVDVSMITSLSRLRKDETMSL